MGDVEQASWESRGRQLLDLDRGLGYRALHGLPQQEGFTVALKKVQKFASSQRPQLESAHAAAKKSSAANGYLNMEFLRDEFKESRSEGSRMSSILSSSEWICFFEWAKKGCPVSRLDSLLTDTLKPQLSINKRLLQLDSQIKGLGIICPPEPTPLSLACAMGQVEVVQLLLNHRADPTVCGGLGFSPLHAMYSSRSQTLATGSAASNDLEITAALLDGSLDPNVMDAMSGTPLLAHAAASTSSEVLQLLVLRRADVAGRSSGQDATALHTAAANGNVIVIPTLLELRADPSSRNYEGNTPADVARARGRRSCVIALNTGGASAPVLKSIS